MTANHQEDQMDEKERLRRVEAALERLLTKLTWDSKVDIATQLAAGEALNVLRGVDQ